MGPRAPEHPPARSIGRHRGSGNLRRRSRLGANAKPHHGPRCGAARGAGGGWGLGGHAARGAGPGGEREGTSQRASPGHAAKYV
eukprot:scaffold4781_cov339-Prasinococcus_capsulatus_cf.AAC.11